METKEKEMKVTFRFGDTGEDIARFRIGKDELIITVDETKKFNIMKDRDKIASAVSQNFAKELDAAVEAVIAELAEGEKDMAGFTLK